MINFWGFSFLLNTYISYRFYPFQRLLFNTLIMCNKIFHTFYLWTNGFSLVQFSSISFYFLKNLIIYYYLLISSSSITLWAWVIHQYKLFVNFEWTFYLKPVQFTSPDLASAPSPKQMKIPLPKLEHRDPVEDPSTSSSASSTVPFPQNADNVQGIYVYQLPFPGQ